MKTLLILVLLFSLVACEEDIDGTKGLSSDELTYLNERSRVQCMEETKAYFDSLKNGSNERFYLPKAYADDTMFKHGFKVAAETADRYTHKVTVWKSTLTDVYFLINIDDTNDAIQFLKIPKTTNDFMFDALQVKHCANDKAFILSTSAGTYSFTIKSSVKEMTHTFTMSPDLLAFFSRYKETRKEQALDTAGNLSGAAVTMIGTFASPVTEIRPADYKTYNDYVTRKLNPTLCLVSTDLYPYVLKCDETGATTFSSSEL